MTDRVQHVIVNGTASRDIYPTSGVPQGSHLGSILISLYVNDVRHVIRNSSFLLNADDLNIYNSICSPEDVFKIQENLDRLVNWCKKNYLEMNIAKCKAMRFSKKIDYQLPDYIILGLHIYFVTKFWDFGVTLDRSITSQPHVDTLLSKVNRMLWFFKRQCVEFSTLRTVLFLYNACVQSVLEYCSIIWAPYLNVHINRLEAVQKRLVKFEAAFCIKC